MPPVFMYYVYVFIYSQVNLDSVADALSENLEKSGTRSASVTEWHILRPPVRNDELDENGVFHRRSMRRSTTGGMAVQSNTLPSRKAKVQRSGSSHSCDKLSN